MKTVLIKVFARLILFVRRIYVNFITHYLYSNLGSIGNNSSIAYPFMIRGAENLELGNDVSIGNNCTIYCTRAKCTFGDHSFTGPNLTIITGDHAYWPGTVMKHCYKKFLDDVSPYDKPVIIEEDVWIGANVTILKGVTISRGAIIAAGSIVTSDVKPYSIVAGCKAKHIKYKWPDDIIKNHELSLNNQ